MFRFCWGRLGTPRIGVHEWARTGEAWYSSARGTLKVDQMYAFGSQSNNSREYYKDALARVDVLVRVYIASRLRLLDGISIQSNAGRNVRLASAATFVQSIHDYRYTR